MMLWNRIHDSARIKSLINHCHRYYHFSSCSIIHGGGVVSTSANRFSAFTKTTTIGIRFSERNQLYGTVRFYAAPILPNEKKPEPKAKNGVKMNEKITAEFIRLVVDDDHEVVSRGEALDRARKLNMDLVEVDRLAKPPVCKIMDYHREKYKKQLKAKEKLKTKAENTLRNGPMKECRFTKKTEQKDLETKAKNVKRVLEKGHRVKCMAIGTEDQDLGAMLARLSALIEDFAVVESGPMVEKKQAYVVVRHKKFGFKKGSSKKSLTASPSTSASINSEQVHGPTKIDEELDHTESHSESEDIDSDQVEESEDIDPDHMDLPHARGDTMAWTTTGETEDIDVFGFDEESKGVVPSSGTRQMSGNTDGVFPLEYGPNASSPYSKSKLEAIKSRLPPPTGPKEGDENRYKGRNEIRSRFQAPLTERPTDSRPEASPRPTSQGYRGPPSTSTVRHGPAQVSENRYNGQRESRRFQPATSIDRTTEKTLTVSQVNRGASATNNVPRGSTQVGDNRYNGQADVRSRFQRTNPIERTVDNAKSSEFSPVHSTQFSQGPGATSRVHPGSVPPYHGRQWPKDASGSPSTEHKPPRTGAAPDGNLKMSEQADPNVAERQRPSYGIFSAPKQARIVANELGGGRELSPVNSSGSPRSSEDIQTSELGKTGKWGLFNKEAPKACQQSNSDYQTKVQR